jgi:hypothetical protein
MGGCRLDREIEKALLQAGSWKGVELEKDSDPYDFMPRVSGRLVKE